MVPLDPAADPTLCQTLAEASHELCGPLQAIVGAAAMLESGDPEQQRHIEVIRRSSDRALRLVRQLLDGALVGSRRLNISPEPTDLRRLIDEAWDAVAPAASAREVTLFSYVPERLAHVRVDADRIIQVLTNLIDNAVRFTPARGRVVVDIDRADDGVQVSVVDAGSGIAEEDLPKVFEPFWQAPHAVRGAAGLGLAIAKGIIAAHGGRIWARSMPGGGTAISFTLPTK